VTVVLPTAKIEPEGDPDVSERVGFGQLSLMTGVVKVIAVPQTPTVLFACREAGQEITGG